MDWLLKNGCLEACVCKLPRISRSVGGKSAPRDLPSTRTVGQDDVNSQANSPNFANDSVVDDLGLSLLLLLEVLGEQFLILTGAVFADFFS